MNVLMRLAKRFMRRKPEDKPPEGPKPETLYSATIPTGPNSFAVKQFRLSVTEAATDRIIMMAQHPDPDQIGIAAYDIKTGTYRKITPEEAKASFVRLVPRD